jgi:hypothetical protein
MMLIAEYNYPNLAHLGQVPWTQASDSAANALIEWRDTTLDWLRTFYNPYTTETYEERQKPTNWRHATSINPIGSRYPRSRGMSLYQAEQYLPALQLMLEEGRLARDEAILILQHEDPTTVKKGAALERLTESATKHINEGYLSKEDAAQERRTDDFYFKKLKEAIAAAMATIKNPTVEDEEIKKEAKKKGSWHKEPEPKVVTAPSGEKVIIYDEPGKEGEGNVVPVVAGAGALALALWLLL